ncbi:MAG: ribokinase [Clostridia bacterium]|nr:ribokinase [Clostridia bacterium]
MKILVFGSFNIDKVYSLPRLPQQGETLYCENYEIHVGGKGLNQALAFKKAGADVVVAGKVGKDGDYLTDYLEANGVDTSLIDRSDGFTGHTIIEVEPGGQNQMILFGGANREITRDYCDKVLAENADADLIMMQYETSCVEYMIEAAYKAGIKTAVNPSPYVKAVNSLPYDKIDFIIANESEGAGITGEKDTESIVRSLCALNNGKVILTLGDKGSIYSDGANQVFVPAFMVDAVDTTGAGDTFTGYCLTRLIGGDSPETALRIASAASALEVTVTGAAETIPDMKAVSEFLKNYPV